MQKLRSRLRRSIGISAVLLRYATEMLFIRHTRTQMRRGYKCILRGSKTNS